MQNTHPQFEVYPVMEDADPNQPTGDFRWRYRLAVVEDAEEGVIAATSSRLFGDRETAEADVFTFVDSMLTPFPADQHPENAFIGTDPATGAQWAIIHVEEA